jgi:ABC-2 type transport system permease protein
MNHLLLILKREYINKVRNKSFIIMTFLSPLLMAGVFGLVGYLSSLNNDKIRTITILDETKQFAPNFINTDNMKYNVINHISLEEAKKKSEKEGDYGLLYIPKMEIEALQDSIKFFSEDSPSLSIMGGIEERIKEKVEDFRLAKLGVNVKEFRDFDFKLNTGLETYKGKETSKEGSLAKLVFGGAAGYLLFMFIIIYGNMIMRSVIEEKTSRIIEVIISSVKPLQLMLGKIFGTSLAGITQVLAWLILGSIVSAIAFSFFGFEGMDMAASQEELLKAYPDINVKVIKGLKALIDLPILNLIIMFILFFIGGYLLYASLYAAIGAAVDNETDTQQFMMPILIPLILAVYVGFFTVIDNPHGTVSQIFSYIPFTSPVVMLMRIPFGVPLWQQLVSVCLLFATFLGTVWFAAKIYRVGILMYGKKPSYKELFKWLKY